MAKHYCRHCREEWNEGDRCPKCGMPEENYAFFIISIVLGVLLFLAVLLFMANELFFPALVRKLEANLFEQDYESSAEPEETQQHLEAQTRPAPTEPPVQEVWIDGLYAVGADIPAGEYVVMPDGALESEIGASFHISVFNDSSLDDNDRAFGGWVQNNAILRVEEGQFVELLHAVMYSADEESRLDPFSEPGIFCVGRDIPAGTYSVRSCHEQYSASCMVGTDPMTVLEQIHPDLHIPLGETETITLQEGEYLKMEFCHLLSTGGAFISYGDEDFTE